MLERILRDDYTREYGIPRCEELNLVYRTNEIYFGIEDNNGELIIYTESNQGTARFFNNNQLQVTIANYDKFVTSLPHKFQRSRKRCDIIVCDNEQNLILGELKDSRDIKKTRKKARKQLYESLTSLLKVPSFSELANRMERKRCCYFNKQQPSPPALINAISAFNRPASIFKCFKMVDQNIESKDFEFWEYLGGSVLNL